MHQIIRLSEVFRGYSFDLYPCPRGATAVACHHPTQNPEVPLFYKIPRIKGLLNQDIARTRLETYRQDQRSGPLPGLLFGLLSPLHLDQHFPHQAIAAILGSPVFVIPGRWFDSPLMVRGMESCVASVSADADLSFCLMSGPMFSADYPGGTTNMGSSKGQQRKSSKPVV